MNEFIEDLMQYTKVQLTSDSEISKPFEVCYQYMAVNIPDNNIQFSLLNAKSDEKFDCLDGSGVVNMTIQIMPVVKAQQTSVNGITVTVDAQKRAMIYLEKIRTILERQSLSNWNSNIVKINLMGAESAKPLESNPALYSANLKYDFYIRMPYTKVSAN